MTPSVPQPNPRKAPREPVHGVLLLDKPLGLSSNDALMRARRLMQAEKAGHGGTLDPLASGLLPLAFGEATKFADDLLSADKTYIAGMRLGQTTTTGDREGEVTSTHPVPAGAPVDEVLEAVLARFRGALRQVPPMYSALKKDGKALYEYARAGETVERPARDIVIHALERLPASAEAFPQSWAVMDGFPVVHLQVTCSKGTYIRVLVEDIGEALGYGAHLASLRRVAVESLDIAGAVTLQDLEGLDLPARRKRLQPVDALLSSLPRLELDDGQMRKLQHGQKLSPHVFLPQLAAQIPELKTLPPEALVAKAYGPDNLLLGTVDIDAQALRPRRLVRTASPSPVSPNSTPHIKIVQQ